MKRHLHNSFRALFLSLAVLLSLPMLAVEVEIDGINYELVVKIKEATVIAKSSGKYSGKVVIPESVEHEGAAYSVTSIGDYAFLYCSGLTSVTIGNSVTSIGDHAFSGCSGLTSVTISDIAAWCNIDFEDYASNPLYYAHHLYLNGEEVKDLVIPNSVTSIGRNAFSGCSGLTSVTIPYSVTSIGEEAFYECSGLTSVTIPYSVTSIGDYAFLYCSGLTSVTIGSGVTSIGDMAFSNCPELLDVYCYAEKVPSTERNAFDGSYPEYVTLHILNASIDSYMARAPWSSFRKIVAISTEVDGINYDFDAETKQAAVIAKSSGKYSGEVVIPESVEYEGAAYSVTSIGKYAFDGCSGLTSVTIPNSVTSIGSEAFYECSGLTSVTIGNSVKSIGFDAFDGCSGLTSVHISDIAAWCNIDFDDFDDGDYATTSNPLCYAHHLYLNREEIKDLVIPNSVTSIGDYAFYYCSGLTSVTIPNSVTSIGGKAFCGCSGLTSVAIGNSVASIGQSAFDKCSGLISVHVSDIAAWCNIDFGDNPLSYAHHLYLNGEEVKDLVIPNSVKSIGDWAFYYCKGLTSVTIPNSVTSIGMSAFEGCSGLTSVTIPNSVTSIGSGAFRDCPELLDVYCYAEYVPSTNSNAFNGSYPEYATLYVPAASVDSYKASAPWSSFGKIVALSAEIDGVNYDFKAETKQATVIAKSSGKYSGEIVIPESVEHEGAAYSVTSIGDGAFFKCSGLTSVTIPNSVTSIGNNAFNFCSGLTSVTIGNSVKSIGDWAFGSCSGLTSVTIGNSVESIGYYAFGSCSNLHDVYCYAENVPSTNSNAFSSSPIANATLHVPAASINSYKATAPWSIFGKIVALGEEETGIGEVKGENGKAKTAVYDLSGRRVQKAQKGIFIQNGKVMVK